MIRTEENFLDLIDQHQNIIHSVCKMYTNTIDDQQDLFQEVLVQLWKGYPNFKGEAKVTTWMYRVSLYTAITHIKKVMKMRDSRPNLELQQSYEPSFEPEVDGLQIAIDQLDEGDRAVVLLYLEDKSYKEMSQILGLSESNVGVRINRIKKKLKSILIDK